MISSIQRKVLVDLSTSRLGVFFSPDFLLYFFFPVIYYLWSLLEIFVLEIIILMYSCFLTNPSSAFERDFTEPLNPLGRRLPKAQETAEPGLALC